MRCLHRYVLVIRSDTQKRKQTDIPSWSVRKYKENLVGNLQRYQLISTLHLTWWCVGVCSCLSVYLWKFAVLTVTRCFFLSSALALYLYMVIIINFFLLSLELNSVNYLQCHSESHLIIVRWVYAFDWAFPINSVITSIFARKLFRSQFNFIHILLVNLWIAQCIIIRSEIISRNYQLFCVILCLIVWYWLEILRIINNTHPFESCFIFSIFTWKFRNGWRFMSFPQILM